MDAMADWMQLEKRWMARYRWKLLKTTVCVVLPLTALLLGGLMAGATAIYDGFTSETAGLFATGAGVGAFLVGVYILCLLPGLSAGRLRRGLRRAAKRMGLSQDEAGQMAAELLAAANDPAAHIDFVMSGPNTNNTPASFYATPHYAYLRGGYPLVNLVRLADTGPEGIRAGEEQKTATITRAKSRSICHYTLYTICFYSGQRAAAGCPANTPADAVMGFFSQELRDKALAMIRAQRQ